MKKIMNVLLILGLTTALLSGCGSTSSDQTSSNSSSGSDSATSSDSSVTDASTESNDSTELSSNSGTDDISETTESEELLSGLHHVTIEVENYGTISVELDADTAPITVTNFINLANSGFYDGLTFHRIIDGFMIQGGDPVGNGTGGSGETIKGEFSENNVTNDISHVRGTISMARSADYDSASSQFFIVQSDSTYLDGEYAAFGTVTDGMDLVDQICADTATTDSNGTVSAENQPVITTITVID